MFFNGLVNDVVDKPARTANNVGKLPLEPDYVRE